ncbi:hypothetical protein A5735_12715 [Mycolicibacter heraklionensis]|nr:hypothetical protein A5735_12715 [Mycolicibacter heraklionensis]
MLLPIARSAYAHDVALWASGGDQTAFTSALAMHETDSWKGRHTGGVDESVAAFDEHERWIALHLARQGHNVIALPTRHLAGLRSPDAAVSGLLVEFKTYTGRNPRQLLCRVGKALPQADRVVVGVDAPWDSEILRSVFRAATALAHRRGMRAVMFIGNGFQLEWGDWNGLLTSSATTQHPGAPTAGIDVGITEQHTNCRPPKRYTHHTRRLRPCPTPAGNHGP